MKEKRVLSALLVSAVIVACAAFCSGASLWEADSPALLSSVVKYGFDYETKEWTPRLTVEYQYDNAYPTSVCYTYPDGDFNSIKTFAYVFENGKPVSRKQFNEEGVLESITEYTDGNVTRIDAELNYEETVRTILYSYANGGAHFTLKLSSSHSEDPAGSYPGYSMEETDSVSVTTSKKDLLEKTVNTGLYANWNEGEEKEWMRFNGTYTAYYDKEGILSCTSSRFRAGPAGGEDLFELTKVNGRITEAVRSIRYPGQEAQPMAKYVFAYNDTKIDPVRYASMINAHIMDEDNNYYEFFWY